METCDALIVGGGPAGSTCAWQLAQNGLDVLLLDKAIFPRDKVCAGWITPAVLQALQIDPMAYARGRLLEPISAFRTGLIAGTEVETRYPDTVSYGIRRCEFDHYLLQRSAARLRLGQALTSLERRGRQWIVNGSIATPMLIGAAGHFCPVARHLGARPGADEAAVTAKEIEFQLSPAQIDACSARPGMAELYFCADLKGYGWCLRKGDYLNVGLGREGARGLAAQLKEFCALLERRGSIPPNMPDGFHGHAYLLYGRSPRKLVDDGVLLIGDAAGLAYRESGEGIRPAVESGLMAAATVLEAGRDYRRQRLLAYCERLVARFGTLAVAASSPGFLKQFLAGKLLASPCFTRHMLLDRWFLHGHQ